MNQSVTGFFSIFISLIVFTSAAVAQSPAAGGSETDMFISNQVTCGMIDGKWLPGVLKGGTNFIPYTDTLAKLKLQIKNATAEKAIKLQNKSKKFKLLNKNGIKECKSGPPSGTPTPVQTPSQTQVPGVTKTPAQGTPAPGPTPRPTQTVAQGCFNAMGDTTCFGIGQMGLRGNITSGKNIYENGNGTSTSCIGCHKESELRNKTFNDIANSLQTVPEMLTYRSDFTNSDIAHLVAYLNRFN